MWSSVIALSLLLTALPGGHPTAPDPKYLLLVPTILHGGGEERLCLQLSHLNESVTVDVILELTEHNETLLHKEVTGTEEDNCVTFQIPKTDKKEVGYVTLDVDGETVHFKSRRSILIKPLQNLVFMQTDKPIYKPGQTVLFRMVSLDDNFFPAPEKFSVVYIEDPQRNRLSQWLDVETKKGITQESFALSSEPSLGTYKVVAEMANSRRVEHPFSVEEYVLPKYEVEVKMPSVITILDKELKFTVCGKYTYGKPVSGEMKVRVYRKFTQSYSRCPKQEDSVYEELSHHTDANGCFSDVVNTKIFQMQRSGYEMKIHALATIIEEGTDVEIVGEGSSEIQSTISKVSFKEVDTHFKRGIPLYGRVYLEDAAGNPISNEKVKIFVGFDGTNYTYTTGSDGTADFSIDTSSIKQSSFNIRASYKTTEYCYGSNWLMPSYQEDSRSISHVYSRSKSYVKIQPIYGELKRNSLHKITVHYILTPEGIGEAENVMYHYMVMAKGGIVVTGSHKVGLVQRDEASGDFSFDLQGGTNIAPLAKILVYIVLDSGEVIADSTSVKMDLGFGNEIKLSFPDMELLPGSQTSLSLQTEPNSLCAIRAVDQSVLLLKPEAELSAKSVYDLLPIKDLSGYNHDGHYLEEPRSDPCLQMEPIFMNGVYYRPSAPEGDTDAYKIFQSLGLKVSTNTNIRIPHLCQEVVQHHYQYAPEGMSVSARVGLMSSNSFHSAPDAYEVSMIETVRKYFPETWIWHLTDTDSLGSAQLPLTVPDSITTWKVGMYCTSREAGFGLSETMSLRTFQPFFIDITLPFSVVRGEEFTLKASLANYLQGTTRVRMSLENSDQFEANSINNEDSYCVEENGRVTVSWEIKVKSLDEVNFTVSAETLPGVSNCGNEIINLKERRRDTITKHILVKPEGIEKEETHNMMVCGKDSEITEPISLKVPDNVVEGSARAYFSVVGELYHESPRQCGGGLCSGILLCRSYIMKVLDNVVEGSARAYFSVSYIMKVPDNVVEGSARAYFSVVGDVMGTAMHNLGSLLQMPHGCGEQNMALFILNIYILAYLNSTGQLNPETKAKALSYLSSGYQRQLNYKHSDGSYSTFGPRYGEGNTWLTAFVMKSFSQARAHVYIEEKQISDALLWLSHQQKDNGCFRSTGPLFNNALKGGVRDDEIKLTAFVTTALLESPLPVTHPVVRNAMFCLDTASEGNHGVYTKSLMAYAFTLSGNMEKRNKILQSLDELAIKQDGTVHWRRPDDSTQRRFPYTRAPSVDVEMTSYALMAILSKPKCLEEDLTLATKIVSWLVQQWNPNGGFSSTLDTVVALQALSLYGSLTHSHDSPRTVLLSCDSDPVARLQVEDSNRLLLQRVPLPKVPGEYKASITGSGCLYMQANLRYNVPHPKGDAAFSISVTTEPETCDQKSRKSFSIAVNVSYVGKREKSNMAIVEIKLPSGYFPEKTSVKMLTIHNLIKRTDTSNNKVIVYYDWLSKEIQSFKFLVEQDIPVSNLQPATATVYDYYETDDVGVTKYNAPCGLKGIYTNSKVSKLY
ncbi:alpha-2-macroglobulin-like [Discoglossus pictus]